VLPLPAADTQQPDQTAKDKVSIHILEKAVVVWSKQIKTVLKSDPDAVLKVGCCKCRSVLSQQLSSRHSACIIPV
jgi:hypothetical protein